MTDEPPAPPRTGARRLPSLAGLRDDATDALRFFTRLPVPARWTRGADGLNGVAIASPLAGAIVGLAAGAVLTLSLAAGLPPLSAAVLAAIAATVITGALHLDGLADCADGLGGRTRERRLEIMRDSRLGSFGGAALVLALLLRVSLISALVARLGAFDATLALVAAAALSRPLAFLPALLLDPTRADGLGAAAMPKVRNVAIGVLAAVVVALACAGPAMGISAVALAGAAAAAVVASARRAFGGYTGDVCGAAAEVAELAALVGLLAAAT